MSALGQGQKPEQPSDEARGRGRLAQMTERLQKITFGDMRDSGVHGVVVYCSDYRCAPRGGHASGDPSLA
jgi:hypothetical protein